MEEKVFILKENEKNFLCGVFDSMESVIEYIEENEIDENETTVTTKKVFSTKKERICDDVVILGVGKTIKVYNAPYNKGMK